MAPTGQEEFCRGEGGVIATILDRLVRAELVPARLYQQAISTLVGYANSRGVGANQMMSVAFWQGIRCTEPRLPGEQVMASDNRWRRSMDFTLACNRQEGVDASPERGAARPPAARSADPSPPRAGWPASASARRAQPDALAPFEYAPRSAQGFE
jgi:hypothetical protein